LFNEQLTEHANFSGVSFTVLRVPSLMNERVIKSQQREIKITKQVKCGETKKGKDKSNRKNK